MLGIGRFLTLPFLSLCTGPTASVLLPSLNQQWWHKKKKTESKKHWTNAGRKVHFTAHCTAGAVLPVVQNELQALNLLPT